MIRNSGLKSHDLQHLYVELGLSSPEIERAEEIANSRDPQLRGLRVLQCWRKKVGKNANRIAIINALEKCNRREAVEYLKKQWNL